MSFSTIPNPDSLKLEKYVFYPQLSSDPFHCGRITNIGNQSYLFVDFGLNRLDSGFAHAKAFAPTNRYISTFQEAVCSVESLSDL
ncbi:hypothetical protein AYI68_g4748 [Smittium mucronatum]|uniref:Uncharacterized protein n=1 Tax=Smittium mucronatum TaxID=133383 RepID=A0A1R0GW94_9FUNG|nr:hypothetical protein AYI68_g4748 [Smittium mucronatum]